MCIYIYIYIYILYNIIYIYIYILYIYNVKLFADDTSLFSEMFDPLNTANVLNNNNNKWAEQWKMVFDTDPTK